MADSKNWFEVDRKGLSKLIEERGKISLIHELISNAWDADGTTVVAVTLTPEENTPKAWISVTDDAPDGFADLRHAWTLFAESNRKGTSTKRGRFNLGEKLVLALCDEATITTTTSGVMFDHRGRTATRSRTKSGSDFTGLARITRSELQEIRDGLKMLIPPANIATFVDGQKIPHRTTLATFEATLPTVLADDEGNLRPTKQKATVSVYDPLPGEAAHLYEMGIPVVATGDRWHVDISIKVPLNMNRDNVTPSYLKTVRGLVVEHMHLHLRPEDASTPLVNDALANPDISKEALNRALDLRYGPKRAIFDPSDKEANHNLVAKGYTIIYGPQLTKDQWNNVKRFDAAKPSGQIAPTKNAVFSPDGEDRWIRPENYTRAIRAVVAYTKDICRALTESHVTVAVLSDITAPYAACYGSQGFVFNLGKLGHKFFNECMTLSGLLNPTDELNSLIIHELGHHYEPNHLSERYHEKLCELGAKMTRLALTNTTLFYRDT